MAVDGLIETQHMGTNYETIIKDNLLKVYERSPDDLQNFLPAEKENDSFLFRAFGEDCSLSPLNVTFSGILEKGPKALLISLLLYPLPKIALCYVFYMPDDDFPASATCLFSSNAGDFMPLDGLADMAEYTSKKMIELAKIAR